MGTKIYVSSSIYNLAGDEIDRPNFLKSSLFSGIMNPYDVYLGETIVNNYLTGPGIMQRTFFNWSVRNDIAGLPTLEVTSASELSLAGVEPFLPNDDIPAGKASIIQRGEVISGDFLPWAEKHVLDNFPLEIGTPWVADYDETTDTIIIQFDGGGTTSFNATTAGFDFEKKYVAIWYYQVAPANIQPLVTGTTTTLSQTPEPDQGTFTMSAPVVGATVDYTLNRAVRVTKSYDNGDPDVVTDSTPSSVVSFDTIQRDGYKSTYLGGDGVTPETTTREEYLYQTEYKQIFDDTVGTTTVQVVVLGSGVEETTTTWDRGDVLQDAWDYRVDIQDTIDNEILTPSTVWFYEVGSGNATLDALVDDTTPVTTPAYYPFIPIRLNNKSIQHPDYDSVTGNSLYAESVKAYKKAIKGGKLDEIIEEVEANPDINDIDYSYIQFGVSVNALDQSARKYMYEFFRQFIAMQPAGPSTVQGFIGDVTTYDQAKTAYENWVLAQSDSLDALFGTAQPALPVITEPAITTFRLNSDHPSLKGFDMRVEWTRIDEEFNVATTERPIGQVWTEVGQDVSWDVVSGSDGKGSETKQLNQCFVCKQTAQFEMSRLVIWGMVHKNFIYRGKAVKTTLKEGLQDSEESVFLVPMHAPTIKALGVKDFTQLSMQNTFITFNSYLVVKKKWYQTFLGMLLIIIAVVVISVLINPAAAANVGGFLGNNAIVGGALGLSGTAAVVAGAVANAIAAIVISAAISEVSVKLFGETWGPIIAAITTIAMGGFNFQDGFQFNMTTFMSPQNILKMTSALANGYNGFVMKEIEGIQAEMEENQSEYDRAMKELNLLMKEQGLINDLSFDQMSLTDSVQGNGSSGSYVPETLDGYINRTLMLGTDVVDTTISMVTDYPALQKTLPKG